jgi:hypothetical protein
MIGDGGRKGHPTVLTKSREADLGDRSRFTDRNALIPVRRKRHIWHRLTDGCQERQEASDLTFRMRLSEKAGASPRLLASRL